MQRIKNASNTEFSFLLLQSLDLGFHDGGHLPCCRDEEPVHVEDSDLVVLTCPKFESDDLRLPLLAGYLDYGREVS